MREIQETAAKAQFIELLQDVERGESITITRNGKKVAALIPVEDEDLDSMDDSETRKTNVERLRELRRGWRKTNVTLEEILEWRHEGHKY